MELRKEVKPAYSFDISGEDVADMIALRIQEFDPDITEEELEAFREQFYENVMGCIYMMTFTF